MATADAVAGPKRGRDERLGRPNCFVGLSAARKMRRDGRRERATGTVRIHSLDTLGREIDIITSVEHDVDRGVAAMPALDDDIPRTKSGDRCGRPTGIGFSLDSYT